MRWLVFFGFCLFLFFRQYDTTIISFCVRIEYSASMTQKRSLDWTLFKLTYLLTCINGYFWRRVLEHSNRQVKSCIFFPLCVQFFSSSSTPVCALFLIKLRWPKNESICDILFLNICHSTKSSVVRLFFFLAASQGCSCNSSILIVLVSILAGVIVVQAVCLFLVHKKGKVNNIPFWKLKLFVYMTFPWFYWR